ncbi:MAG TPA: sterol desaturase family protein [Methylotenera sp.]|nr:sterol desaturase family protein [Methylotenera sp.]
MKQPISNKPLHPKQIRTEILRSMRTILLFGVGMLLPWAMLKLGIASVTAEASMLVILMECLMLVLWNDLHFYAVHRLMHHQFKKAHGIHHQSIVSTPFATYSMSVTEALLLGSVMPLVMPFHEFSIQALLFLPIWSILINSLAHSNCNLFAKADADSILGFIQHHQNHHSYYQGNYSFFFPHLDRWFGTAQTQKRQI